MTQMMSQRSQMSSYIDQIKTINRFINFRAKESNNSNQNRTNNRTQKYKIKIITRKSLYKWSRSLVKSLSKLKAKTKGMMMTMLSTLMMMILMLKKFDFIRWI